MIHTINSPPPLSADTNFVPASTSPLTCLTDVKAQEKVLSWGLPGSLSDLGVKEEMLSDIVKKVMNRK